MFPLLQRDGLVLAYFGVIALWNILALFLWRTPAFFKGAIIVEVILITDVTLSYVCDSTSIIFH
jgi:hypothetical protein